MAKIGIGILADDTGESIRALQHWCDLGVLLATVSTEKKGRGYHREFDDSERKWALLASALNKLRVPLVDIANVLKEFRSLHKVEKCEEGDPKNAQRRFDASALSQALHSESDVFVMVGLQHDSDGLEVKISVLIPIDPEILVQDSYLRVNCAPILAQQVKFTRETKQCLMINLTEIWKPLRQ